MSQDSEMTINRMGENIWKSYIWNIKRTPLCNHKKINNSIKKKYRISIDISPKIDRWPINK